VRLTPTVRALAVVVLLVAAPGALHRVAAQNTAPAAPGVFSGTLEVAIEDDFVRGRSALHLFLDEETLKRRLEIKVKGPERHDLKTGMKVRVKGTLAGGVLSAGDTSDALQVLAEAEAAQPLSFRKAVVILVDITDGNNVKHAIAAACDDATARAASIMFGATSSVDGCYQDGSFTRTGWGGAAYPGLAADVFRVGINEASTSLGSVCNYGSWGSAADTKVGSTTLAAYQHRIYVLPSDVGCSWAGLAAVGCSNCYAYVKAYGSQPCGYNDTFAHELGHNVGMRHSSTDTNNDGAIDSTCAVLGGFDGQYCDTSDFMGISMANLRTPNAPHKVQMGWVSGSQTADGSGGGDFTIAPLELPWSGLPQVVKVTPPNGAPYYLSYRVRVGYDANLPHASLYADKTNIHRWSSGNTLFVTALGDGQTFSDPATGFTFMQTGHSATGANVVVTTNTVCTRTNPTVTVSPSSQTVNAVPATRAYTLSVRNNDGAACASTTFGLVASVGPPLIASVAPSSLTLSPGASATATLSVTAGDGTPPATYTVGASTAADGNHASMSASASLTVTSDATPPTVPTNVTASLVRKNKVSVTWTASTDGGGSGVAFYHVYRNGIKIGTAASAAYNDMPGNGTWSYTVQAQDGAGNVSAQSAASNTVKIGRK